MSEEIKKSKKDTKKDSKNKRRFFKDFKAELKKVIWPTPKQLINNTIAVITIVLITAVIVLVLDLAFEGMNKYGINNLRNYVESHTTSEDEDTTLESNEENIDSENEDSTNNTDDTNTENQE